MSIIITEEPMDRLVHEVIHSTNRSDANLTVFGLNNRPPQQLRLNFNTTTELRRRPPRFSRWASRHDDKWWQLPWGLMWKYFKYLIWCNPTTIDTSLVPPLFTHGIQKARFRCANLARPAPLTRTYLRTKVCNLSRVRGFIDVGL